MAGKGTVFAIFVYKYDDKAKEFIVADDPSDSDKIFYRAIADPDAVLREARDMIFTALIKEYRGPDADQAIAAMNKAVESADAKLIRLPHGDADLDSDVGFLIGQLDAPVGDQDAFAYVRALVVKAKDDSFRVKFLPRRCLPAVNGPEEI